MGNTEGAKTGYAVVFDGLNGDEEARTPLVVNAHELRHLLEVGAVKIQANYVRSALLPYVAQTYGPMTGLPEQGPKA